MVDFMLIVQLFVLINPLSSLPFVVAAHKNGINVRRLAFGAVITAFILAVCIALVGKFLFQVFGISPDSFRVAGGIILLLLALDTIRTPKEDYHPAGNIDSLIAILATPLLTGPATISFITIKSHEMSVIPLLSNICIAFLFVGIVFVLVSFTISKINTKIIDIISKVLGLFLTAMAIEMMSKGLREIIISMKH
jgi:multiple antibiotic resistance protein